MFYSAAEAHAYITRHPTAPFANAIRGMLRPKTRAHWNESYLFYDPVHGPVPSLKETAKALRIAKEAIASRIQAEHNAIPGGAKFYRPWDIVPALSDFRPTGNDYGVGVEVELGFNTLEDAQAAANYIKNWKYTTLDWEGPGSFPIEATFPPELYSRLNTRSRPVRYCRWLANNIERILPHATIDGVGTHVNVSVSPQRWAVLSAVIDYDRYDDPINRVTQVRDQIRNISNALQMDYFGRHPYGCGRIDRGFIEWKLFNSVPCPKTMLRYIDIAVSLTELAASDREITQQAVLAACEAGYTKRQPRSLIASVAQANPADIEADEDDFLIASLAA